MNPPQPTLFPLDEKPPKVWYHALECPFRVSGVEEDCTCAPVDPERDEVPF